MPTPEAILEVLTRIANEYLLLAVVWHAAIALAVVSLVTGFWRPTRKAGATLLALPALSVSVLSWMAGNPFNGATFAAFALLLTIFGLRLPSEPARRGPTWAVALGSAMIAYAWVYPHFLESQPGWMYLVAAPTGLVPCPTTSAILGFGLIAGGFGSRAWSITAALFGAFYALFGMLRLGVWLDAGLLVGAVATFLCATPLGRFRARESEEAVA